MNKLKSKLIIAIIGTFAITVFLFGCTKNTELIETKGVNVDKVEKNSLKVDDFNYINGNKSVNPETLDWDNDNLNVFYGFDNTENAYVFYSEKEMIEWVKTTKRADEVLKVLKDIETAKQYAIEIGEFEIEKTTKEFDEYMKENFKNSGNKGVGQFFHDTWFGGSSFLIAPWPKRRLKSKNDDKTSSLKFYGNSMKMSSKKNWKGSSRWVWTPTAAYVSSLGSFDNKLSSYWTW